MLSIIGTGQASVYIQDSSFRLYDGNITIWFK
jgi:hypothetical protein